jgi:hypothetical protein
VEQTVGDELGEIFGVTETVFESVVRLVVEIVAVVDAENDGESVRELVLQLEALWESETVAQMVEDGLREIVVVIEKVVDAVALVDVDADEHVENDSVDDTLTEFVALEHCETVGDWLVELEYVGVPLLSGDEETDSVTDAQPVAVGDRDDDRVCESDTVPELQKLAVLDTMDAVDDTDAEPQLVAVNEVEEEMVDDDTTDGELDVENDVVGEPETELVVETVTDVVGITDADSVVADVDEWLTVGVSVLEIVTVDDVVEDGETVWEVVVVCVICCDSVVVKAGDPEEEVVTETQPDGEGLCVTEPVIDDEPDTVSDDDVDAVTVSDTVDDRDIEPVNVGERVFVGDRVCDVVAENVTLPD